MTSWPTEVEEMALATGTVAKFIVEWDGGMEDFLLPKLIHDRIMKFAAPGDIDASAVMVQDLRGAEGASSLNLEDVVNFCTDRTDDWSGTARDGFVDYLGQIESAVNAQTRALEGLAETSEAYSAVVSGMRSELSSLLKATGTALDSAALSPLEIGRSIIEALGTVATGSLVGGIVTATGMAVAHAEAAQNKIEILYSLAGGLDSLWTITEESISRIASGYRRTADYLLDNALTLNPPTPPVAMSKAFDPDEFSIDVPDFGKYKDKVPTTPLVKTAPHVPDAVDIILDSKRHEEDERRKRDAQASGGS